MKVLVTSTLVLLASLIAVNRALPTPSTQSKLSDEVEIVPLEHNPSSFGRHPIIDTGADFGGPFDGVFENFQGIMERMRKQMEDMLKRIPFIRSNSTEVESGLPQFPAFGDFGDLGNGNTTSVTKVIDGHKVVINDTVYKKEDDFGGAYVKVRIIDVKPDSTEVSSEASAEKVPVGSEREPLEISNENEIVKSSEVGNKKNNAPEKLKAAIIN